MFCKPAKGNKGYQIHVCIGNRNDSSDLKGAQWKQNPLQIGRAFEYALNLDFLIIAADFRMRSQTRLHFLMEEVAHIVGRGEAFNHDHQFRLVG